MVFDNGEVALSWLINEANLVQYPRSSTGPISGSLKTGGVQKDNFENDVEDKYLAYFDLEKLLKLLPRVEADLLVTHVVYGFKAAIEKLSKGKEWAGWRRENELALSKYEMTCSKKLFEIMDKWEIILYENDYIR